MNNQNILIIGGGIGGLTSAIALAPGGHRLTIVEKDPDWAVYGVGIIQQANVVRAVKQLGILDDYLDAGFGFDFVFSSGVTTPARSSYQITRSRPGSTATATRSRSSTGTSS